MLKNYEVILNGPALGLAEGENIRLVEAEGYTSERSGQASFFVGEEEVAQFSNVFGVSEVSA